jgi:hypothetical protein
VVVDELLVSPWTVSLDLPDGWDVRRLPERPEMIVGRPAGATEWHLSVEPVALGMYSLWDVAQAAMRKHTGGKPEHFELSPDIVDGRGAFRFAWTDGVQHIVTWWLVLSGPQAARIEYGDPDRRLWHDGGGPQDIDRAATSLVRGIAFVDRGT